MPIIHRVNALGLSYQISAIGNTGPTTITLIQQTRPPKQISVNHPFETINRAWFKWMMRGDKIQDAFFFLNADEREFLITGITPEEWAALFKDDEDEMP